MALPTVTQVRVDWCVEVVKRCQALANLILTARPTAFTDVVTPWLDDLDEPQTPAERLVLRGLLMEIALRCGTQVAAGQGRRSRETAALTASLLASHWRDRSRSPRECFAAWTRDFFKAVGAALPVSPVDRAAAIIEASYAEVLDVKALARQVGCHPRRLRALFKKRADLSIRAYQTRVRVERAREMLRDGTRKVDAVAAELGFGSRKGFYQAIKRATGRTPSQLRATATGREGPPPPARRGPTRDPDKVNRPERDACSKRSVRRPG